MEDKETVEDRIFNFTLGEEKLNVTGPTSVNIRNPSDNNSNKNCTNNDLVSGPISKTRNVCFQPLQVVGVQKQCPVAWSADGQRLIFVAGNNSFYVCIVEVINSKLSVELEKIIPGHRTSVECVSFHPTNPNIFVSAAQEDIQVYDVVKGMSIKTIVNGVDENSHDGTVFCFCWLYEGSVLATGSKDSTIKLWNAANSFEYVETLEGHKATVLVMTYSTESRTLISAGRDSTIKVWDAKSLNPSVIKKRNDDKSIACTLLANMDGHRGDVVALSVDDKGNPNILFSGARDSSIKVWDLLQYRQLRNIQGHSGDVRRIIALSNGDYIYSCSLDGSIKLWKLFHQDMAKDILTDAEIENNREAADKKVLEDILYGGASVEILAVKSNTKDELLNSLQAHRTDVFTIEVNSKYPLMASSSLHEVKIWDISNIASPVILNEFIGHSGSVTDLSFVDKDNHLISSSTDYSINLYDISTIKRDSSVELTGSVLCVAVAPNEKMFFAAGNDYNINGYSFGDNCQKTKQCVTLCGHSGRVYTMVVSQDSKVLVSGAHDYSICTWQLRDNYADDTLSPKQRIEAHQGHVLDLSFSDLEKQIMLASCSNDHSIRVWNVQGAKLKSKWSIEDAHPSVVSCLTYGKKASSTALFSGGWDKKINVWTPGSSAPKAPTEQLEGHVGRITCLNVSEDGRYLVSTSADGTAILWDAVPPYTAVCCYLGTMADGAILSLSIGHGIFSTGYDDGMIKIWPLVGAKDENGEDYHNLFTSTKDFVRQIHKSGASINIRGFKRKSITHIPVKIE